MNLLPRVIAIAAITIDGKIARHSGQFSDWTSKEDKEVLHEHLDNSDVIVVGNNTYKTAQAPLSKRNCIVFTHSVETSEQRSDNILMFNPNTLSIKETLSNYKTVALLGGTQVYTYFLERDLIDELYLTVEPLIFGSGLSLFSRSNEIDSKFHLISTKQLNENGSLLLHYKK